MWDTRKPETESQEKEDSRLRGLETGSLGERVLLPFPHATDVYMKTTSYWITIWQQKEHFKFLMIYKERTLKNVRFFVAGLKSQKYTLTAFGELCLSKIALLLSTWSAMY